MQLRDPYLDAGMRGWIANTARQNYWKVQEWYDLEDLVQDGYMCYYKCRKRYRVLSCLNHPNAGHKKHMMALVQTAFHHHIINLANRRTAAQERVFSQCVNESGEAFNIEALLPAQPDGWDLTLLLKTAPAETKALLALLYKDGQATVAYARRKSRYVVGRIRETTAEHYRRLLAPWVKEAFLAGQGFMSLPDVVGLTKAHFLQTA